MTGFPQFWSNNDNHFIIARLLRERLCELLNGLKKNKNPQGVSRYGILDPRGERH
jgi:hypothetical protein